MIVTTQVGEYALDVDGGGRASGFYAYNGRLTPERTLAEETFLESDDYLGTPNGSAGGSPLWMGEAAFGDTLTVQSEDQPEGELLLPMSLMAAASTAAAIPPVSRSLDVPRSEEHTSEHQSQMRIWY